MTLWQSNTTAYVDIETDITDRLTVQAAVRHEKFNNFDSTTNYKLAGLFRSTDSLRMRVT